MTISSTARLAPFVGAGATATFPFAFKVFEASDLLVTTLNTASGALAVLTLNTDYTVALNDDQDTSPGGSITLTAGNLASGFKLTVTTSIAALQGLDLANAGAFYPDVINNALDLLTVLLQQVYQQVQLAIQFPITDAGTNATLPTATQRAGQLLMFDVNGNLALVPVAPGSGVPGAVGATGAVNGANASFTFAASPTTTPVPVVFAGGIFQTPVTDYSIPTYQGDGIWEIVFTNPPAQGPITVLQFS